VNSMNDISLVAQVAVFHNKRAFDTLVKKYQEPVRRFFMNQTLGDSQLSDDLAQDTFVKAYVNIASFHGMAGFSTWLLRIAYNVFYDYTRSKKMTDDIDTSTPAVAKSCGREDSELKMDIYHAFQGLKPEERTCITLQLIEGETIDHIAAITGIPPNTVKSHLSRGKEKLATYLKQNGYDR
jgi:RNA polymerase sigma-70 factor, ECF subfamily